MTPLSIRSRFCSVVFLVIMAIGPVSPVYAAPEPILESTPKQPGPTPAQEMDTVLDDIRLALQASDWSSLHAHSLSLKSAMYRNGMDASNELSALYLRAASRAGASGKSAVVETLLADARIISPDWPDVYFTEASFYLKQFELMKSFDKLQKGLGAMYAEVRGGLVALSRIISGIGWVFLSAAIVYACSLLLRYLPLISHDIAHKKTALADYGASMIVLALLVVPTAFGGGMFLFPVVAIVLFWVYQRKYEKIVSSVIIAGIVLSPLIVSYQAKVSAALASSIVNASVEIRRGPLTSAVEAEIHKLFESDPVNKEALLALALHERKKGRTDDAFGYYGKLLQLGPGTSKIYNNMANIYIDRGETDLAIEYYQKAIAHNPGDAMPHFNLSQVLRDKFAFEEGKKEYAAAEALDPELIRFVRDWAQAETRLVLDEGLSSPDVWAMAMSPSTEGEALSKSLGKSLFIILPPYGISLLGLVAAFLVILLEKKRAGSAPAYYCGHCGRVSCGYCAAGKLTGAFCSQCLHAFVRREGVSARARMHKILEINSYRQKKLEVGRWLSLVLPGAGHFYLGASGRGFAWSVFILASGMMAVVAGLRTAGTGVFFVFLAVTLILHSLSVWSCFRMRKAR